MRLAHLSLTLLLSIAASPAWAQLGDSDWGAPRASGLQGPPNHVLLDMRFSSHALTPTTDQLVVAPIIQGWFEIMESTSLQLELPLLYNNLSDGTNSEGGFRLGNPYVAGHYRFASGDFYGRVGAGVGLPAARVSETSLVDAAVGILGYAGALGMDGFYDTWRWLPNTLAVVVPFRFEMLAGEQLSLAADGALMGLASTREGGESRYAFNLAGEAAYRTNGHAFGARLQVATIESDGDGTQVSLVPFARIDLGTAFLNLRLLLNLGRPGASFDEGGIWGASAGLGFYL